jgi:hypothetical protein
MSLCLRILRQVVGSVGDLDAAVGRDALVLAVDLEQLL